MLIRNLPPDQTEPTSSSRASARPSRAVVLGDDEVLLVEMPPRRRRRLNDNGDDEHSTNRSRGPQVSPEVGAATRPILILDSDEEDSTGTSSHSSGAHNRGSAAHRHSRQASSASFRIFSPSPPLPQYQVGPAVPPPVIAGELPFAILPPAANGDSSRNRLPFDEPPQPPSGPSGGGARGSSLPRQPIRLGGGLFSRANRRVRGSSNMIRNADTDNYNPGSGAPQDPMSRLGRVLATYVTGGNSRRLTDLLGPNARIVELATVAGGFFNFFSGGTTRYGLTQDYKKDMTHPGRPGPGWTYEFGPQEGEEKKESEEILVCAQCLDPLLRNADGVTDMNEKERRKRRVWGMRCGHVLDGKCVEAAMIPEREHIHDEDQVDTKGEEKLVSTPKRNNKGKGKAKQTDLASDKNGHEYNIKPSEHDLVEEIPDPFIAPADEPITVSIVEPPLDTDNSIRSRLRSRGSATTIANSASPTQPSLVPSPTRRSARTINQPSLAHSPLPTLRPRAPAPSRTTNTKRKRRGKKGADNGEEVIQDRYHWPCPVPNCGKVHESIKVNGIWKTDPENGPIAAYV